MCDISAVYKYTYDVCYMLYAYLSIILTVSVIYITCRILYIILTILYTRYTYTTLDDGAVAGDDVDADKQYEIDMSGAG